jgi:hypothetical protein
MSVLLQLDPLLSSSQYNAFSHLTSSTLLIKHPLLGRMQYRFSSLPHFAAISIISLLSRRPHSLSTPSNKLTGTQPFELNEGFSSLGDGCSILLHGGRVLNFFAPCIPYAIALSLVMEENVTPSLPSNHCIM